MISLEDISKDNWEEILQSNSFDDIETRSFLNEHEDEILNILIENGMEKSLEEKRKEYIKNLLAGKNNDIYTDDVEDIIEKILEVRKENDYSILQLGKRITGGSSYIVYEFGDKVIKLGKYFKVLNSPHILQPEVQMRFGNNNDCMTIYEKLPEIFSRDDFDYAQEMYNRIRDDGILWFDAIANNIGRTNNRRDENDDGLRIIDAQYMEYERDVLLRIDPERNEQYRDIGPAKYDIAIKDYIIDKGYGHKESQYQKIKKALREKTIKQDIIPVAEQSSISGLQKLKNFLSNIFHRRDIIERDDK